MADSFVSRLISELTEKTTAADTDLIPVSDKSGNFFKMTWKKLKELVLGTKDISGIGDGTVTGAISELNTNIFDLKYYDSFTSSIANSQVNLRSFSLPKGTYVFNFFIQLTAYSNARNYLAVYADSKYYRGTLPIADINNGVQNFSSTSSMVIEVTSDSCYFTIAYQTLVSCRIAYYIYKIK